GSRSSSSAPTSPHELDWSAPSSPGRDSDGGGGVDPQAPRAAASPESSYARERGCVLELRGPRFDSGRVHFPEAMGKGPRHAGPSRADHSRGAQSKRELALRSMSTSVEGHLGLGRLGSSPTAGAKQRSLYGLVA